jgi:hypothetical protein
MQRREVTGADSDRAAGLKKCNFTYKIFHFYKNTIKYLNTTGQVRIFIRSLIAT